MYYSHRHFGIRNERLDSRELVLLPQFQQLAFLKVLPLGYFCADYSGLVLILVGDPRRSTEVVPAKKYELLAILWELDMSYICLV
jgi:hypothetical protein